MKETTPSTMPPELQAACMTVLYCTAGYQMIPFQRGENRCKQETFFMMYQWLEKHVSVNLKSSRVTEYYDIHQLLLTW